MEQKSRRTVLLSVAGLAGGGLAGGGLAHAAGQPVAMNAAAPAWSGKPGDWINTDGPLTLAARLGKVTAVHFRTFACWNRKSNVPAYQRGQAKFAGRGVAPIGVHTPELDQERAAANVRAKVKEFGIEYGVPLDNGNANWRRWKQQFRPCVYLVDRRGRVRARWDGELNYGGMRGEERMGAEIERLLGEPA